MPWKSVADLPKPVREAIADDSGRRLFLHVANAELKRDLPESRAVAAAWAALKRAGYEKGDDGKWHKKAEKSQKTLTGQRLIKELAPLL